MIIELYIKGKMIELINVDVSNCDTFKHREKMINEFANYLRVKWRDDIMITSKWEIVLFAESKMNTQNVEEKV